MQDQKRLQAIERANKALWDQGDQVKSLHSALLYSDMMQEQELVKELKQKKVDFEGEVERRWAELLKQQCEEYDRVEEEKKQMDQVKKEDAQRVLRDQLQKSKLQKVRDIKENYLEGLLIKKQAKQALEEEKQEREVARQKVLSAQAETLQANQHLQKIREAERLRELEEEKKIEDYRLQKEKANELRRKREEEKFQEKLDQRQKMIDARIAELTQLKNREDEILSKQIKEAEEKKSNELAEQQRQRKELQSQIDLSRKRQMERKRQEKEQEQKEGKEFKEFWRHRMHDLEEADRQEKEGIHQRNKNLENFLKMQMDMKTAKLEAEAQRVAEQEKVALERLEAEQDQFNGYAEKCIKEWAAAGKNVTPIILELKNYRKKVLQ